MPQHEAAVKTNVVLAGSVKGFNRLCTKITETLGTGVLSCTNIDTACYLWLRGWKETYVVRLDVSHGRMMSGAGRLYQRSWENTSVKSVTTNAKTRNKARRSLLSEDSVQRWTKWRLHEHHGRILQCDAPLERYPGAPGGGHYTRSQGQDAPLRTGLPWDPPPPHRYI